MPKGFLTLAYKHPKKLAFGGVHYFYSSFGQSFLLSLFVPYWTTYFDLSHIEFSRIYSAATLFGAAALYIIGNKADKMDIRNFSLLVGLTLCLFSFVLAFSSNSWIYLLISLSGIRFAGQGLMPLTGATALSRYFDKNRGKSLSLASSTMSVAEISLPILILWLIKGHGWQDTWLIFAVFILLSFVPLSSFLAGKSKDFRFAQKSENKSFSPDISRLKLIRDWRFLVFVIAVMFNPFVTAGVFIHQFALITIKSWPDEWFAVSLMGFGLARILSTFLTGYFVDKFSAKQLIAFIQIPATLGFLSLLVLDNKWALMIFTFGNGFAVSAGSIIGTALWVECYGNEKVAKIKSMVSTLMIFSTALSPLIFAHVFQKEYFDFCMLHLFLFTILLSIMTIIAVKKS